VFRQLGRMRAATTGGNRGYTFVELLVVASIVMLLASAVQPLAKVAIQRQREVELRRALRELRTAIDDFQMAAVGTGAGGGQIPSTALKPDSEGYPPSLEILVEGVTAANDASGRKLRFLRRVPDDEEHGVGPALLSGQARLHVMGRAERVRRVFEE
jgi:general secretion pathway protein G